MSEGCSFSDPESSVFRLVYSPVYNSASESFIEALLDNMILEISNCVVYFSIIKFSSLYTFRQTLYRSKFLSLRNFERFKNNLNWQLLTKNYICKYIIDSHYITDKQIKNFNIGDTFFIVSQSGTNYYSPYINKKLVLIGKEPWVNYNRKGIIFID